MFHKMKQNLIHLSALTGFLLAVLVLLHAPCVQADTFKAKGIDVSRWQGTVDWAKVKEDGIEFVMLGIGRYMNGKGIPDPYFETNMKGALAQGIHVGVYLYSMAVTEEEARDEADFVLDQIDGYKISYPVAFDIEDDVHKKLTTKQRTDITIAFLEVIREAGYYPMIYASENWFNESMDLTRLTDYDKWVARWASTVSFKPISMWQYSSAGRVSGINGNVDLDYSYKDYSKLIQPRTRAAKRRGKTSWQTDGTHFWYVSEDGTIPKSCFMTIDGNTYYLGAKGYRQTGWKMIQGKYYYFAKSSGIMQTGWLTVNGKTYYLDPDTGVRKTGWLTLDGKKYYLKKTDGTMVTGWMKLKKKYYYFGPRTGAMQKGLITIDGEKYFLNKKTGVRITGWKKIKGNWYFFGPSTGAMQKNKTIGEYKFDMNGVCLNRP